MSAAKEESCTFLTFKILGSIILLSVLGLFGVVKCSSIVAEKRLAPDPKTSPNVTYTNFCQIKLSDPRSQVEALLGGEGKRLELIGQRSFTWTRKQADNSIVMISVRFDDKDKVIANVQSGLLSYVTKKIDITQVKLGDTYEKTVEHVNEEGFLIWQRYQEGDKHNISSRYIWMNKEKVGFWVDFVDDKVSEIGSLP